MLQTFLLYLLKSSLCLLLFAAFYKLVLQKQTFFHWNRYYLLTSLVLSIIIPLIKISVFSHTDSLVFNMLVLQTDGLKELGMQQSNSKAINTVTNNINIQHIVNYFVLAVYFVVVSVKLVQFIRKLVYIKRLISSNTRTIERHYWIVSVQNSLPAFSFFRYIFINKNLEEIDKSKFDLIKQHELIHVNQLHSLDNILFEIFLILFWFNPIMYFCKKSVHETHEFIVDEQLTKKSGNKKEYSHLLLNLAIQNVNMSPFLGFSAIKINKRIHMLNKQKSKAMKKLLFILVLPLIGVSLLSFSLSEKQSGYKNISVQDSETIVKLKVGNITWKGNTLYSSAELSENLGLKQGDEYNHDLQGRLWGSTPVIDMFMDKGYVFYNATFEEIIKDGIVDLTINIYEGNKGVIGIIDVVGNNKISKQKIMNKMKIKSGDLFSRTGISSSIASIQSIKGINIDGNDIRVIPVQNKLSEEGYSIINLEFAVSEE